jgi:hypothetical protein
LALTSRPFEFGDQLVSAEQAGAIPPDGIAIPTSQQSEVAALSVGFEVAHVSAPAHHTHLPLLVEGQAGAIPMNLHRFPCEEITLFRAMDVAFVLAAVFACSGIHGPTGRGASNPRLAM